MRLELEAAEGLGRGEAAVHDFEGDRAARLVLHGFVDGGHAAGGDDAPDAEAADALADQKIDMRGGGGHGGGDGLGGVSRGREKGIVGRVVVQERGDFAAQGIVIRAGLLKKAGALVGRAGDGLFEELEGAMWSIGGHCRRERLRYGLDDPAEGGRATL